MSNSEILEVLEEIAQQLNSVSGGILISIERVRPEFLAEEMKGIYKELVQLHDQAAEVLREHGNVNEAIADGADGPTS